MKNFIERCLLGAILICAAFGQAPPLKKGVAVQLATAGHAVEMRAADEPNATVVAITADGKVYVGTTATDPDGLSGLKDGTVYVKADARVPYQRVVAVLDALRGKSVVLLTSTPETATRHEGILPPYGVKVTVGK